MALPSTPTRVCEPVVYATGSDEAVSIAHVPELDVRRYEDVSLVLPTICLPDWTPASDLSLYTSIASNSGIDIVLETGGQLSLLLGNGTAITTYTTNAAPGADLPAWSPAKITVTIDRSGNATFYLDGAILEAEDISAQETDDLIAGADHTVLDAAQGTRLGTSLLQTAS
ncbi:MAG: hypothetical protein HC840_01130 [Leptolyngbyaceae cyanobacterium RM2_2_4]|nr:hypothetical protein [Leptolyngbyaceae cyanobacterium RM2_2_4]